MLKELEPDADRNPKKSNTNCLSIYLSYITLIFLPYLTFPLSIYYILLLYKGWQGTSRVLPAPSTKLHTRTVWTPRPVQTRATRPEASRLELRQRERWWMDKLSENHRKIVVSWDFMGFTLWLFHIAMENHRTFEGKTHNQWALSIAMSVITRGD